MRGASPDTGEPPLVRWSFLLFVAAIPLEVAYVSLFSRTVSVAKLSGLPFLGCYLWYHAPWPGRRSLPRPVAAVAWMGAYVAAFVVTGLTGPADQLAPFLTRLFVLVQLCAFLWIVSDLVRDADLARCAVLAYALGTGTWALGILLRIPGLSVTYAESRLTSLHYDPNYLGTMMALGAVILLGVGLDAPAARRLSNVGLFVAALPLLAVVAATGSRTAAIALGCGLVVYLLSARAARGMRLPALWLALGAGGLLLLLVMGSSARVHWGSTWNGLQTRARIATASVEMALERPLLGWGVGYMEELGPRTGQRWRDAHNLVLTALVEVGVVGTVPFLVGLGLCARGAARGLAEPLGRVPLAVLVTMLVANVALPLGLTKSFWLVLALGAARDAGRT